MMDQHNQAGGPLLTAFGFFLGWITNLLDFLGSNSVGITCLFMIISVIGGLWLSWQRNKILKDKKEPNP